MRRGAAFVPALVAGLALAAQTALAVDVKLQVDKAFDFRSVRTWAWHPEGPGEVKMARTGSDDPEAARQQAEPVIVSAVTEQMGRRGYQPAAEAPDLVVMYYLLLTLNISTQTLGQFVPATPEWGLPPLTGATQSYEVMHQGSLVLDISSGQTVVWRGVARANLAIASSPSRRESLIREAVRDLVRRLPRQS
jgi:hypothetical protein